ncbi:MAG: hypothetical protein SFT68_03080, partial [Rickettsiaceae bacterium]|nr:hypothetical protein [Rickettsiaceae bacterium]
AITAKEGVDCVNGSGDACGSVAMSVALSVVPGPSPKWIGRIWDGVKSLANVKKVENAVTVAKTAEKVVDGSATVKKLVDDVNQSPRAI